MSRSNFELNKEASLDELYSCIVECKGKIQVLEMMGNDRELTDAELNQWKDLDDELEYLEREYRNVESTTYEDGLAEYQLDMWKDERK